MGAKPKYQEAVDRMLTVNPDRMYQWLGDRFFYKPLQGWLELVVNETSPTWFRATNESIKKLEKRPRKSI